MFKMKQMLGSKAALALGTWVVYVLVFIPLYHLVGRVVAALAILPVGVTGWLFGMRAGLLAGLLAFLLNMPLMSLVTGTGWAMMTPEGLFGSVLVLLLGAAVGRLRDLGERAKWELAERKRVEEELRKHRDHLEELIGERTAKLRRSNEELQKEIAERKRAEEKIEHLNLVLRAIRSVNQLITRERDRDRLLQGACESLIETRGYHNAWIALLDESTGLVTTAEAGLGEKFPPLAKRLKRGELTACGRSALAQPGVVVTEDPASACADCPLSKNYAGRGAMTVRLEHGGKVYGLLSVSIPTHLLADEEEQALFREVAGDIAFGLHSMELEEERKRAKESLEFERRRLSMLLETFPGYIYLQSPDYSVRYANQYFVEHFGEPKGRLCYEVLWGRKEPCEVCPTFKVFDTKTPQVWEWSQTPDGRIYVIYDHPFIDSDGSELVLEIGVDITERKQAEAALKEHSERLEEMVVERTKELREAQEQLMRREKLAVLGQLAGGVGHELRNPLGVISNAVYFLQLTLADADETTKEYLEIISAEVNNSTKIVSDLLDFSRTRTPDREETAVSELVAEVLKKRPPPEEVEVSTQIAPELPPVFVDPQQIGLVLINLVVNAYQVMPEGGRLTISASEDEGVERRRDAETRERGEGLPISPSPYLRVSISDTGCGIPSENLAKVFEPLFTTRARGIGLGLATSRILVEANGGSIEVESEVGKGSTFTIRLPIREGVA